MKKITVTLMMMFCVPALSIAAEQAQKESNVVVQKEQKSVFKGLLYRVWGKLRTLSPKMASRNKSRSVITAGVRGAETTDSLINPYWKGDKTDDPAYIKELTEFNNAHQLAENGDLPAAVKAFSSFISNHGDSDLKANAQFAMGISYGGMGQTKSSIDTLRVFVKENPKHAMVADAKQVIAELQ
ncbi:MAG: tetratricopeptide repeat protein [Gammaproteobacteria bacterium]|nr:tetratricopeptide repeat protein [Gammaproteobacteria bacterium]MCW8922838.1 tetratricopeptide repeat protein [Gammaproteobacteria bacterium]